MNEEQRQQSLVVRHPSGPIALDVLCSGEQCRLSRLRLLAMDAALPPRPPDMPSWLQRLCDDLSAGDSPQWALRHCDFSGLTSFRRKVLTCLSETVAEGELVSYRELAKRSGAPNATRAVGGALAANPFPLILPCHRVVTADGRIGGFMGDRADRSGWKRRLLEREGHRFERGRVPALSGNMPA